MRRSRAAVRLFAAGCAVVLALAAASEGVAQEKRRRVPRGPRGPRGEAYIHTVKAGETLDQIARKYGVDVPVIELANGLRVGEKPNVGDEILVPRYRPKPEPVPSPTPAPASPVDPPAPPPTGTIGGVVEGVAEDLPGMPSHPSVLVRNVKTGARRAVLTDDDKRFKVDGLPFGTYDVTIQDSCSLPTVKRYTLDAVTKEVKDSLKLAPVTL